MNYKEERDKAALAYGDGMSDSVTTAFAHGADWALQSEGVQQLVDMLNWIRDGLEHFNETDEDRSQAIHLIKHIDLTLEAYSQAVKEIEK